MPSHDTKFDTALVILNYNGRTYLEKFLPSVLSHSQSFSDIIIGDNASTDDSILFLTTQYPAIKIIRLAKNHGYAEGYNQTLKEVSAKNYFLLNSDVELCESWESMVTYLDAHADVAAIQPKILAYHSKEKFEHAGAAGGYIDSLGYPFCKGRILDYVENDHAQYDAVSEIFWASGAAMLIKANVFHDLGGFDSDFFAHMEEIDWCWRAKKCGWKIIAYPKVKVYHVGGGTLPYTSARKVFLNFRNNISMILKNETGIKLIYKLPLRFILDFIAAFQFLFKKQAAPFLSIFKAYANVISWLPSLASKRKKGKELAQGKKANLSGIYHGSILISYFIKGQRLFSQLKI